MQQDPYTRVPNLVYDIVGPLLSSPERDCLFYIVRRTWGFPDANGAPKARDTIGLEQFENGISSGNTLLDLGTQLSRNTIKKALRGLEEKELVEVRYSCLHCLWEQERGQEVPEARGRGYSCPRCSASLSRSWALAELTPRKLNALLNERDRKGRIWSWDSEQRRFRFYKKEEEETRRKNKKDIEEEIARLRELVWYPDLVEQAIAQAEEPLQTGKMSLSRQLGSFWKPVWELQEKHPSPPLLKHSLEQTLRSGIIRRPRNDRWHRYLATVARNSQSDFGGSSGEEELENKTRDLLRRAAALNGSGQTEEARELLGDILSLVQDLSYLFDGDSDLCDQSLRQAFKNGSSDFVGIEPDPYGLDFYPEWSWK